MKPRHLTITDDQLPSVMRRFVKYTNSSGDCWLWRGRLNEVGYGHLTITTGFKEDYMAPAHRVSYMLFRGPIPPGVNVRHVCDVRHCVNPDHLLLGSHDDNMKDMAVRHRAGRLRLTDDEIRTIRALLDAGGKQKEVALKYGLSRSYVSAIGRGIARRHVE